MAMVFEAAPVSLLYFAANITVLFALGTAAEIMQAVVSIGESENTLQSRSITTGTKISLIADTR